MGAQFSAGFVPRELRCHVERPLLRVKVLFDTFKRLCREDFDNNAMFITQDQFQKVMGFDVETAHKHFGYFDSTRRGRASAVVVWGALALCCAEREEPKIAFCFNELLDLDGDGALNEVELRLLIQSVATGVARIKQIRAPPIEVIDDIVQSAFEQARFSGDELVEKGLLDLYNFGMFLKAHDDMRKYLASLEREDSGDAEELYQQQAHLLLELAQLDCRLDEIDDQRARAAHDASLYEDERGGDVRRQLVVGLRGLYDEASSDDETEVLHGDGEARLAAAARLKAKESGRAMVQREEKSYLPGQVLTVPNHHVAREYASKQTTTCYKAEAKRRKEKERERALTVEGGLAYSKGHALKKKDEHVEPALDSKLNQQMERRARRKKALGPRAGDDGGDIFKRLAKKQAKPRTGADKDDKKKAMLQHKWKTFEQGPDRLVKLDVDLFEDLFESLAVVMLDAEAEAALRDMPRNAVGAYSLTDVLEWHRSRAAHTVNEGSEAIAAAKGHLATFKAVVDAAGKTLRKWSTAITRRLAAKKEESAARSALVEEEAEAEDSSDDESLDSETTASQSQATGVATPEAVVPGLTGQAVQAFDDPQHLLPALAEEPKPEASGPCAGNASLKVGAFKDPRASCAVTSLQTKKPLLKPPNTAPDALEDAINQALNDARKLDVSGAQLIALDYRRALQAFLVAPKTETETPLQTVPKDEDWDPAGPAPARSVVWVDLVIDKDADVERVVSVARELEACARLIPRDYAKTYYDRVRCDVVVAQLPMKGKRRGGTAAKVEKPVLRIQVFSRHDPLNIVERSLPEDARPSSLLGKLTGLVDINATLAELAFDAARYHDLAPRLWGPQESELGDGADPCAFRARIRATRKALHREADGVDDLDQAELKASLEREGHASTGAFARNPKDKPGSTVRLPGGQAARERLKAVLFRRAARQGYGELSEFGSKVAAMIFKRFEPDNSGGMDFDEFASMARELGEHPPADSAEYKKSLSSGDVHLKTEERVDPNTHLKTVKVMGVSVEGFVARYARKGSLGTDAALLGCGSLDDAIKLTSTFQMELDADAAGRVELALIAHARTLQSRRVRSWWPLRALFPRPATQKRAALLEWLAFFLKFAKGCFLERTASRISDILGKQHAPDWLTSPGWLFYAVHSLRETLARGEEGYVPQIRKALAEQFGERWTHLHGDLGTQHPHVPESEMVRDPLGKDCGIAADDQVFNAMGGVAGVGRFDKRRDDIQDLTGLAHVNVMRVASRASSIQRRGLPLTDGPVSEEHDAVLYDEAFERLLLGEDKFPPRVEEEDAGPPTAIGGLSAFDPTQEEVECQEKEDLLRDHGSNPFCDEGALQRCGALQVEVDDCNSALQRENTPQFAKDALERRRDARVRELKCYAEAFERREVLALARAMRSYDALRDVAAGPCGVGFGTFTRTVRCELDGFLDTVRLGRLFPAGMGESAALGRHEALEKRRATDRVLEAYRKMLQAKELMRKAAEIACERAMTAEKRRVRRRLAEESRIYGKGEKAMRAALFYATKYGPQDAVADRKRLETEELWLSLIKMRKARRGEMSVGHAVSVNNLAVMVAVRGRANKAMLQLQEALEQAQHAITLAEAALEDCIRAEAASTKALFEEYHQALNMWDRLFAKMVCDEAKQDAKRRDKMALLDKEVATLKGEETADEDRLLQIKDRMKSLENTLANMKEQQWNARFEIDRGPPKPPKPLIEVERHEGAMLVLAVCLSNELLIVEDIGPPPDRQEDLRRNKRWRQCVALYACASDRGRSQLDNLNRRFARLRDENYMPEKMDSSSDEDSDNDEDESIAPEAGDTFVDSTPLHDVWYEHHGEDEAVPPLSVLGCGIEIGGFFPPPSPSAIREAIEAKVVAKEQAKATVKLEEAAEKKRNRGTEAKLRRMRRAMSMITDFDEETLLKLEKVDPKRAIRIRANMLREKTLEEKRLRNLEIVERRRLRKEASMQGPTASFDPCSPVQSVEAIQCQKQIEYIRELKESRQPKKEIKAAEETLKQLQEVHKETHGNEYDEWIRFTGSYWETVPGRSNTPVLDRVLGRRSRGSLGERPEALQLAKDRGSKMRRASFEGNRDELIGRPTRLIRPVASFEKPQSFHKELVNYEPPKLTKPSTLLPNLVEPDRFAIALDRGQAHRKKTIPPSLLSRTLAKLPALLPCSPRITMEDERRLEDEDEALRLEGEDESALDERLALEDARRADWENALRQPQPPPAPVDGVLADTPVGVTWGDDVHGETPAASFGADDLRAATPQTPLPTPMRHIYFEPRSPTDSDGGGAPTPTPSMAASPPDALADAVSPTSSMAFSPTPSMAASPPDAGAASPTPSMAASPTDTDAAPADDSDDSMATAAPELDDEASLDDRPLTGAELEPDGQ